MTFMGHEIKKSIFWKKKDGSTFNYIYGCENKYSIVTFSQSLVQQANILVHPGILKYCYSIALFVCKQHFTNQKKSQMHKRHDIFHNFFLLYCILSLFIVQ